MNAKVSSCPNHNRLKFLQSARAGFTLLEIMLVVMIIAVLAGSAIYLLRGNIDIARIEGRVRPDLQNISTQLQMYETLNGAMPSTEQGLQALVSLPTGDPQPRRWQRLMPEVPRDPWGNPYLYAFPSTHGATAGVDVYSAGPNRISGDADDIGNWSP